MSRQRCITLLGNNSGRNLGDAAILSSILDMLSKEIPGVRFLVPSIKPKFIDENYGEDYNVKGVNVLPWTGSLRLLGIPTLWALLKSDVALICDGIIFGRKMFSPHNFLITLIFIVPWARLVGCKVVCFSCGIGPFPTRFSKWCAKWVMNLSDLVILRENDSLQLAREIGVTKPIQVTGDAAFVNYISTKERAHEIMKENGLSTERPTLGLNVTPYFDSWLTGAERIESKELFLKNVGEGVNKALDAIEQKSGERPQCVIFSCSPMDEALSQDLASMVKAPVVDNSRYLSHDIQAVMKECGLMMGMRFHSLVLSSGVGTPIVGLVYAPKVKGYMRLLDCAHLAVELRDVQSESLARTLSDAWMNRGELQKQQQEVVAVLKKGALDAGRQVRDRYYPELRGRVSAAQGEPEAAVVNG